MSSHTIKCSHKNCEASFIYTTSINCGKKLQVQNAIKQATKKGWKHFVVGAHEHDNIKLTEEQHYMFCPECNKKIQQQLSNVYGLGVSSSARAT
jgi:hypothetical protein